MPPDTPPTGPTLPPFGVSLEGSRLTGLSPGLRSYPVSDGDGQVVADVHGMLLAGAGAGVTVGADRVDTAFGIGSLAVLEARVLPALRGLFVLVTRPPLPGMLYPDPVGGVPVVYCPQTGRIGGSAGTILDEADYAARFLADRHQRLVASVSKGWIPGTLTAHDGISRLLPNHRLDLDRFEAERFWPRTPDDTCELPAADAEAIVADHIAAFIEDCARQFSTAVALTAGLDSRILLAASRRVAQAVGFITMGAAGEGVDQVAASGIAAGLGLRHRFVPIVRATPAETARWDRLVGDVVDEANRATHPTLRHFDEAVVITGILGEIGRCFFYRADGAGVDERIFTADMLVQRMGLPADPDVLEDIAGWMASLAGVRASVMLDLAYLELRVASWAMAQGPVQKEKLWTLSPFCQRPVIKAMVRAPAAAKAGDALSRRVATGLWPEAMSWPINCYGDWRDRFGFAHRLMRGLQPGNLARQLRKRLAG